MDYSCHLLRSSEEMELFRHRVGKVLEQAMSNIKDYIASLPNDAWINYLKGVPQKNIPLIIGCICLSIDEYDCSKESIDFNKNATMIRYRRHAWEKVSDLPSYAKHREKIQNNGGPEQ